MPVKSHSTRSEWIEITTAPYYPDMDSLSHSTRSEWIEIITQSSGSTSAKSSHSTRSEWIEIKSDKFEVSTLLGLTPHGVSGLKSDHADTMDVAEMSHSTRSEWIEMFLLRTFL